MSDSHGHAHAPPQPDSDAAPLTRHQAMAEAVEALLVAKGMVTPEALRHQVERMDARSPALGARVVARAWTDDDFKARLLADGAAACAELDIDIAPVRLVVVENTAPPDDAVHNVVVCTLCSCYPRNLLGLPPDWYKARAYRSRTVREPRAVLHEFGLDLADDVTVRVHDSTADMRYLVLPARPAGTEGWDEERLAALVTRDCMIGVAVPTPD